MRLPRSLLPAFLLCAGPAFAAGAVQWQRWEATLPTATPGASAQTEVRFTGPEGATFGTPAFTDEDGAVRFRAAFPSPGLWRWETRHPPADPPHHSQRGEVRVAAYTGDNPLYRHGDLRVSADRRYLIHADGTPFLWLGDTAWNAAAAATAAEWRDYIEARVRQRFSLIQIVATGLPPRAAASAGPLGFRADGSPEPAFWRDLEEKIAHANDRGLFVLLTGLGKPRNAGVPRPPGFARHVAARFAGHLVILSPSMDQRYLAENDAAGAELRPLTPHLVTQHPGTHFETARRYRDAAYTDFAGLQTGHHNGNLDRAYAAAREWTLDLWQREPAKPVINLEAMYDGYGRDDAPNWRLQDVRKLGWLTWLSGARGYTYGAGDVPPKVPGAAGGIWLFNQTPGAFDHWRTALAWPSAGQMTHLRDFLSTFAWWRLVPDPDLICNQPDEALRKMAASRSADRGLFVAYLPDNAEIVLNLDGAPAALTGRWFNPVDGSTQLLHAPVIVSSRSVFPRPAGWADAALILTAK